MCFSTSLVLFSPCSVGNASHGWLNRYGCWLFILIKKSFFCVYVIYDGSVEAF